MKKVILGVFVLMMAVSLTGCGETKQEKNVDNFTKKFDEKIEDLDEDMTREMKKIGEEIKRGEKETQIEVDNMVKEREEME
jgi:uncharacterized lipoprotein YehR (DUF1307 family)